MEPLLRIQIIRLLEKICSDRAYADRLKITDISEYKLPNEDRRETI